MKKTVKIIDYLLICLIILSIFQIIFDDIGTIFSWGSNFNAMVTISGFLFDFIFSVEFIVRSISSKSSKGFRHYFLYEAGWIDFLASIPLLLLNSGPMIILMIFSGTAAGLRGTATLIKIVRAVRVTRILRLIRMLKIFGKIENVFSNITAHHITIISALVVVSSVAAYSLLNFTILTSFRQDLILDAKFSLCFALVLITEILAISFIYAGHFAKNVGDPIYVMKRGLTEKDYNFSVHINQNYDSDEVFQLALRYNSLWLPLKARIEAAGKKIKDKKLKDDSDYSDLL